jgi:uncharacterized protein YecT (DUF1311 family)
MKRSPLLLVPVLSLILGCGQGFSQASHATTDAALGSNKETQWWVPTESQSDCPGWSTVALYDCAQRDLQNAEREMNNVFEQTVAAMRRSYSVHPSYPEDKIEASTLLQQGQDAWKQFRDADCGAAAAVHFAPSANTHGLAELECAAFETRRRTTQLREEFLRHLPLPE